MIVQRAAGRRRCFGGYRNQPSASRDRMRPPGAAPWPPARSFPTPSRATAATTAPGRAAGNGLRPATRGHGAADHSPGATAARGRCRTAGGVHGRRGLDRGALRRAPAPRTTHGARSVGRLPRLPDALPLAAFCSDPAVQARLERRAASAPGRGPRTCRGAARVVRPAPARTRTGVRFRRTSPSFEQGQSPSPATFSVAAATRTVM